MEEYLRTLRRETMQRLNDLSEEYDNNPEINQCIGALDTIQGMFVHSNVFDSNFGISNLLAERSSILQTMSMQPHVTNRASICLFDNLMGKLMAIQKTIHAAVNLAESVNVTPPPSAETNSDASPDSSVTNTGIHAPITRPPSRRERVFTWVPELPEMDDVVVTVPIERIEQFERGYYENMRNTQNNTEEEEEEEEEAPKCPICVINLEDGIDVMKTPCDHLLCFECGMDYFRYYGHRCPFCRHDVRNELL